MAKGFYRRDIKKKHVVEKVIEKNGKYFIRLSEKWASDVEFVVIYKVLKV